jgi:hypothetical protein
LAIFLSEKASSPYVKEIASRGPNIYRYLIDCFLITSGFGQWMASDAYFSKNMMVRIPLFSFLGAYLLTIVTAVIGGAALLLKRRRGDIAPVLVFLIGFLAIHMIYQNTKERYVIPILWLLTLFLFYGLSEWMFPALERAADRLSGAARKLGHPAGTIVLGAFFTAAAVKMVRAHLYAQLLLAAIFTGLLAAIVIYHGKGMSKRGKTFIIMAGGVVIGFMMYYGAAAMDHYSLRRVEFKKAGLWFREHAARGERMLITETNIAKYYTGLGDDAFYYAKRIESDTIESLAKELQEKKVKYVFVDDFYIRRYEFKDMNAIDRKAWLFRDIRDRGEAGGLFTPVASFETKGGIKSYIFKVGR